MKSIAQLIRFHRKKAHLTQPQLAKLAGVGKTVIVELEKGKISVRLPTLLKICKALRIEIDFRSPLMEKFEEKKTKKAKVLVDGTLAGYLIELEKGKNYEFSYLDNYQGPSISLMMPCSQKTYRFDRFPPFFEGFLPEGIMLELLLKKTKLDPEDRFEQLVRVGGELVGNITVEKSP